MAGTGVRFGYRGRVLDYGYKPDMGGKDQTNVTS